VADGVKGPAELGRRLWTALRNHRWEMVQSMLHPDAKIESSLAPGRTLGRDEVFRLWRTALRERRWSPRPVGWVELNAQAVMLTGDLAIHPNDATGFDDIIVLVFRDGMLWRSVYYATVDEALAAHPA
jgi:SnoaL-like protein